MMAQRMMLSACLLAGMLAGSCAVRADSIVYGQRDFPFLAGTYSMVPTADMDGVLPAPEADAKENRLSAGLLQFDRGRSRFDLGIDYQYTRYAYERIAGRNRDLHRLQLPIGFRHEGEEWTVSGQLAPGVATSSNVMKELFDRGSGDDYFATARIEALRSRGPGTSWLLGAAHDRAFGSSQAYPVFGLVYRPDRRFAYRLAFPDPAFRYSRSARQRLTVRLAPAGFEWHVVSDELADDFEYEVEGWRLQGTWSQRLGRAFWLDLSLGHGFDRHHEFVDDTGRRIDADLDGQWLFSLGLRWRDGPLLYSNEPPR